MIDDELIAEAMKLAGTKTKRETVDTALRELVDRHRRIEILDLAGKIEMLPIEAIRRSDSGRDWSL